MKARIQIHRPDDVEVSVTLTMKLADWRRLLVQLPAAYPSWKLAAVIRELVERASAHFEAETEVDP